MQVIKDDKSLSNAIAHLESIRDFEANTLKQHFNDIVHSLNPMTIIKEKFNETVSSPFFKNKLVQTALFLGSRLLSSKFVIGSSSGIFIKNTLENLIGHSIKNNELLNNNPLKSVGIPILKNILTKLKFKI